MPIVDVSLNFFSGNATLRQQESHTTKEKICFSKSISFYSLPFMRNLIYTFIEFLVLKVVFKILLQL
jgi:hypothetical protein